MMVYEQNGYHVLRTNTFRCSCYVILYYNKTVLIDTSMRIERLPLLKSLARNNINKLDAIFLTHSHTDHAANARYLSDIYNCSVYVFEKGLNNIKNGICSIPKGTTSLGKAICFFGNIAHFHNFSKFDACQNTEVLTEGVVQYYLGPDAKLAYTPGHTLDSVCIIVDNKIVFMGDCAINAFKNKYPPFADDEKLLKEAWVQLLGTGAELYCPSHGKPFEYAEFKKAYDKLKKQ